MALLWQIGALVRGLVGGERGQNDWHRRHVSKWTLGIAAVLRVVEGTVL